MCKLRIPYTPLNVAAMRFTHPTHPKIQLLQGVYNGQHSALPKRTAEGRTRHSRGIMSIAIDLLMFTAKKGGHRGWLLHSKSDEASQSASFCCNFTEIMTKVSLRYFRQSNKGFSANKAHILTAEVK